MKSTINYQLLILSLVFYYGQMVEVPSTTDFLSLLFNDTRIAKIVNDFTFYPNVSRNDIFFFYWPPHINQSIYLSNENATQALDINKDLVILIHGWLDFGQNSWVYRTCNEFYTNQKLSVNCVSLDWSHYSYLGYVNEAARTKAIGKLLADFLRDMSKNNYTNVVGRVHLVGHSLGAHIAGFAGQYLKQDNLIVKRITGLDSAAPLFDIPISRPNNWKLSADDAEYVSLIHTSVVLIGATEPHGDSDFYVNFGGPIQPQCISLQNEIILCSHLAAVAYFCKSINHPDDFLGRSCKNWHYPEINLLGLCSSSTEPMGEWTPTTATGTYLVFTNTSVV